MINDAPKLLTNEHGHVIMETAFVVWKEKEREMLYEVIRGKIVELSQDQYGRKVVQKALRVKVMTLQAKMTYVRKREFYKTG